MDEAQLKDCSFFVHEKAIVDSENIGRGTRIWAFSHVMKGARIGENCNIGEHCYIESEVEIGNNVVVKNGVAIWNKVKIEDNVFLGPNMVFTNDLFPRSKVYRDEYIPTVVKRGASIGANATLLCGITVGQYAMVGAGAVVTKDVPDFSIVYGNPAVVRGYVCVCGQKLNFNDNKAHCRSGEEYVLGREGIVRMSE